MTTSRHSTAVELQSPSETGAWKAGRDPHLTWGVYTGKPWSHIARESDYSMQITSVNKK